VSSSFYDPEQQGDGIPVLSARSLPSQISNQDNWSSNSDPSSTLDSSLDEERHQLRRQRRQDPDLDDALEDEDEEDSYPSGSSNRESIENPSYGESRRAERDGEEIENFFDKHLGPPQGGGSVSGGGDESRPVASVAGLSDDPDDEVDDQTEDMDTAASGPVASFLHNIIFHNHHSLDQQAGNGSATSKRPFKIGSLRPMKGVKDDNQAGESEKPVAQASLGGLLSPILTAAQSSIVAYESQGSPASEGPGQSSYSEQANDGGIQEIYIGRRPSVMSLLQQAQAATTVQAASEVDQQQYAPQQVAYYQPMQPIRMAGETNVWQPPGVYGNSAGYRQHTGVVPMAASHAHRQQMEQQYNSVVDNGPSAGGGNDDNDEETVTYGLSFGARPNTGGAQVSQGSAYQQESEEQGPSGHEGQDGQMVPMMARAQQQFHQSHVASNGGYVPYITRYRQPSASYQGSEPEREYQQQMGPEQHRLMVAQQHARFRHQHQDQNTDAMARAAVSQQMREKNFGVHSAQREAQDGYR